MPTFALPITSGSLRAATLHSDNRPSEQAETPFAALLDTGRTPRVEQSPVRPEKLQRAEKPSRADTTKVTSAPPADKSDRPQAPKETAPAPVAETKPETAPKTQEQEVIDAVETRPADSKDTDPAGDTTADGDAAIVDPNTLIDTPPAAPNDATITAAPVAPPPAEPAPSVEPAPVAIVADGGVAAPAADVAPSVAVIVPEAPTDADEKPAVVPVMSENHATAAGKVEAKPEMATDIAETEAAPVVATAVDDEPKDDAPVEATDEAPRDVQAAEKETIKADNAAPTEHKAKAARPAAETTADTFSSTSSAATARNDAPATQPVARHDVPLQAHTPLPGAHAVTPHAAVASQPQAVAVAAAVPISGLAVEIVSHAREGKNRFEIRLDPPELGRIDVRLDVDGQGNVTSRLLVERQDTLDLLRRDSTALERALQDAGLKTSNDGLQFSLRDQGGNANQQRDEMVGRMSRIVVPTDATHAADASLYQMRRSGALDIRV